MYKKRAYRALGFNGFHAITHCTCKYRDGAERNHAPLVQGEITHEDTRIFIFSSSVYICSGHS